MLSLLLVLTACSPAPEPDPPAPEAPEAPVAPWEGVRLHVTIDDAPWQTRGEEGVGSAEEVEALNASIRGHLQQRSAKASVFFNCDRLREGDGEVEAWHAAGHVVGNHTAGHARLDRVGAEAWLAEVDRCHEVLSAHLPEPPTWFRYPYLNHGSQELRDEVTDALAERGYRNSPVTVATSDWVLAFAWLDAAGDEPLQAQIGREYVEHMVASVEAAREMARVSSDQEVPHTVLIHVNPLNAAFLDDVLDAYAERGATFADLPTTMADPVYALENRYFGGAGISWLARLAPDRFLGEAYWFGHEEGRLQAKYLPGQY